VHESRFIVPSSLRGRQGHRFNISDATMSNELVYYIFLIADFNSNIMKAITYFLQYSFIDSSIIRVADLRGYQFLAFYSFKKLFLCEVYLP
jgi:hypothetical protein